MVCLHGSSAPARNILGQVSEKTSYIVETSE